MEEKICPFMNNIFNDDWVYCQHEQCMAWVSEKVSAIENRTQEGFCKLIEKR